MHFVFSLANEKTESPRPFLPARAVFWKRESYSIKGSVSPAATSRMTFPPRLALATSMAALTLLHGSVCCSGAVTAVLAISFAAHGSGSRVSESEGLDRLIFNTDAAIVQESKRRKAQEQHMESLHQAQLAAAEAMRRSAGRRLSSFAAAVPRFLLSGSPF